jgi:hypothetical protein
VRLLDQVVQSDPTLVIASGHATERLEAAGVWKDALLGCPLRYVLDVAASERCHLLASTDNGMFAGENEFMRSPARNLWVEWNNPPFSGGLRSGALITSEKSGRRGTMELFWEQAAIDPIWAQASVEFDFDFRNCVSGGSGETFALAPEACAIAPHLRFRPQQQWLPMLQDKGSAQLKAAMKAIVGPMINDVEQVFAFASLLGDSRILKTAITSLDRLNRQRSKHRKAALLEHIEVSFDMDSVATSAGAPVAGRAASRLHHVRGHMVRRDKALFWRRSHFRGDASAAVRSRTVAVMSSSFRAIREDKL